MENGIVNTDFVRKEGDFKGFSEIIQKNVSNDT